MNKTTRVMLCDDSAVMRRLIKSAINAVPSLKVVFEAQHGQEAIENLGKFEPDVVVMDVEMPVMDGIDTVRAIRRKNRKLPVIMFSSLTSRGAEATLDAIAAGASDFATKPVGAGHVDEAMAHLRKDLIPKVKQWGAPVDPRPAAAVSIRTSPAPAVVTEPVPATASFEQTTPTVDSTIPSGRLSAVAIGVSTGGPGALASLFDDLPLELPVPIFITQHMPPVFTCLLAERLAAQKGHTVREATDGEPARPGEIYIAPGDYHMTVARDKAMVRIALNQDAPENSCRPAVDQLYRSVADVYGHRALGIILTGMGQDGTEGARAMKKRGAQIFVQDEASSVVWGMPGHIAQNGLADRIIPLDQVATTLVRAIGRSPAVR